VCTGSNNTLKQRGTKQYDDEETTPTEHYQQATPRPQTPEEGPQHVRQQPPTKR
jgi:hypothetical protein